MCTAPAGAIAVCAGSGCSFACQSGYLNCNGVAGDGCEINSFTDKDNCGGCGNKCTGSNVCIGGTCGSGAVDAGSDADPDAG